MDLNDLLRAPSGMHFMLIEHDSDCPGMLNNGVGCTCAPTMRLATESEFVKATTASRAARRAAERAAAKALAKAKAKAKGGKS